MKKEFRNDEKYDKYIVEYTGDLKKGMQAVDYADYYILNNRIAIIAVEFERLQELRDEVPQIAYVDFRYMYVLSDISPSYVDNINNIKINQYLNLTGKGVIVGIIDTGIDYVNEEFIKEDGTSKIIDIWDQTIEDEEIDDEELYIGKIYNNEQINQAISEKMNGGDPYKIVPSKDDIGHGTAVAGIIGAIGYNTEIKGIADRCEFIIVKLKPSLNFTYILNNNGIEGVPVYSPTAIIAAAEYLKRRQKEMNTPMVLCLGVGTSEGSHDGANLISMYFSDMARIRGTCVVTGVGNEGSSEGHSSGYISGVNLSSSQELKIPRIIKRLNFTIWVYKPNIAAINIISPEGESTKKLQPKTNVIQTYKFVLTNTSVTVIYYTPEHFTGHEAISIVFEDITPGIWTLQLIGVYILNGRYDIWLPPAKTRPEDLVFLSPKSDTTLVIPSTASNIITTSYYGNNNSRVAAAGKGFNSDFKINPDLATIGQDVLSVKNNGGITKFSGSSASSAIIAGACALLLEWGIVDKNDPSMYSEKIKSYLIYGCDRDNSEKYPNVNLGYGRFNLLKTFEVISGMYKKSIRNNTDNDIDEYYVENMFVRISENILGDIIWKKKI